MTICVEAIRLHTIKAQYSSANFQIMGINTHRQKIAWEQALNSDQDMNSPAMQALHLEDLQLEQQQTRLENLSKSLSAELDSIQKLLDNNIKQDFKLNIS